MYQVGMYYTIKTLLSQRKSLRQISRELGVCRKTVSRIKAALESGQDRPVLQVRTKALDEYQQLIAEYYEEGLTAHLIHRRLTQDKGLTVSYPSVARCVERLKKQEVYVPLQSAPGEEAQVDFGYMGTFQSHGKPVKVWVFSMVLSHSRYAYYQLVTTQKISAFIECHYKAFEHFGGVPKTVKLDNLKAGVITPDFYEPVLQEQYAAFLSYYDCAGIACRVRRPQDKGKVESSIKYVKNNFLKNFRGSDYQKLIYELKAWNEQICNRRVHGTTRKVPEQVFNSIEKQSLGVLPAIRYQIMDVSSRKVSRLAHISYRHNYYSVPAQYAGMYVRLESNGTLLRIFYNQARIALHTISQSLGVYHSLEEHKPEYKKSVSREEYHQRMAAVGPYASQMFLLLEQKVPTHWHSMTRGILHLKKSFDDEIIDRACKRAIRFNALSYQHIKRICQTGLYRQDETQEPVITYTESYGHDLRVYDNLTPN